MELDEVLLRHLEHGDKGAQDVILGSVGHIAEESHDRPVLRRGVADVHEVSLQARAEGLGHSLRRCQRGLHTLKVRNERHRSANSAGVHNTHKHVVVAHDVTERFSVRSQRHLRRAINRVHGLRAEAGTRGEDGDLTRAALLHAGQKGEDGVHRSVDVDGVELASGLDQTHSSVLLRQCPDSFRTEGS